MADEPAPQEVEIDAALDAFFETIAHNTAGQVPTGVHNFIFGAVQGLKVKLKTLL